MSVSMAASKASEDKAARSGTRNLRLLTEAEVHGRRDILLAGIQQYNDGYYFEAHETWEELWLVSPQPVRTFLQGLIQMAAGFVHLMRHEYPGTVRLLAAALEKLEAFEPAQMDVDVSRLRTEGHAAWARISELGPSRLDEWDHSGIPRIQMAGR